jgi:uncharacterized protein (DUF1330 family)
MPVAYVIAEIEITKPEGYREYTTMVPATVEQYGGRFLVRGGKSQVLEGDWAERRRVVIEFPSMDAARKWWDSPEYEPLREIRQRTSRGNLIVTTGL